ncbi:hypothetical protein COLO4_03145 [Corchorus olitorius]|uniref:Uncharacterized protein n=1 Tax=Corchorus olitorius TaxID=93759 RepID=A0A1R3KZE1_9ROSI|nr:hypothetical protein COLO4_03145 [Corchorus olitorius]
MAKKNRPRQHFCARVFTGSFRALADLRPRELHVVRHRPQREHRRHVNEPRAPHLRVNHVQQAAFEQQQRNGDHLEGRLQLAEEVHGHALRRANLRHPFTQGRDGDLAADDDERDDVGHAPQRQQHQQRKKN